MRTRDGRAVPRLAESWTSTDDGLTWRFKLRTDVVFHDGSKFTGPLARESLRASLSRPGTSAMYPGLSDVVDIESPSDDELVIRLKRRSAFLLDDLEFPITRRVDDAVIGTGAFKTVRTSPGEVVLAAHSTYYQAKPRIDEVVIRAYPTLRTAWASLMRQEIDVLSDVAHDAAEFVGSSDVAIQSFPREYVYLIAFNSARPKLSSGAVRRALNAAVDRRKVLDSVLKGHGLAASGPLWPHHWAYDSALPAYNYEPSLANTTLDAAGLRRGGSDRGEVPARLRFVCLVPEKYSVLERLALEVQKHLYDVGVDMQLEAVSAEEYDTRIRTGNFESAIVELVSGPVLSRAYIFWRSTAGFKGLNFFGYRNRDADRWFDALRYAATETEYRAAASQLQRTLLEDPPALFLAWSERSRAISRRFEFPAEPGTDPLPQLWRWVPRSGSPAATH